ncbi:TPA: hypothetical protein U1D20_001243 [Streptococcus suis]|nr:hypothetical protein [Streptococcus suis]
MERDILPDLLREVQEKFETSYGKSEVVRRAFEELKKKRATYVTVNDFALEVGDILAEALSSSVRGDKLPDGKMYYNIANRLLADTLGRNFELVSGYAVQVQEDLNRSAKIGLQVQVPEVNQDRIDGLVNRLSSEDEFNKVAWLLQEPIVNFTQSIVDDHLRVNADFHAKAGLTPTTSRMSSGKCCKWCDSLVGNYIYHEEPKNFYRRHQRCRCIIDYHPKNGKRQNSWSKKWTKESKDVLEQRKQMNIDIRDNNRKADIQEYKHIVEVLGVKNAPISLAQFQDLKYNDGEGYEQLKDKVRWIRAKFPSEKSFNGHFEKHRAEFPNLTKEEYQKLASELIASPTDKNILGYETEGGRRVRYDKANNIIVIGQKNKNNQVRLNTMLKPDDREEYYHDNYLRDFPD